MARKPALATRLVEKAMDVYDLATAVARADGRGIDGTEQRMLDGIQDITRHLILLDFARKAGRSFEDAAELTPEMEPLLTNWQRRNLREITAYTRPDDDPDDDGAREAAA